MRGEKMYKVRNLNNDGIYVIGEVKLRDEITEWEVIIEDTTKDQGKRASGQSKKELQVAVDLELN